MEMKFASFQLPAMQGILQKFESKSQSMNQQLRLLVCSVAGSKDGLWNHSC